MAPPPHPLPTRRTGVVLHLVVLAWFTLMLIRAPGPLAPTTTAKGSRFVPLLEMAAALPERSDLTFLLGGVEEAERPVVAGGFEHLLWPRRVAVWHEALPIHPDALPIPEGWAADRPPGYLLTSPELAAPLRGARRLRLQAERDGVVVFRLDWSAP